MLARRGKRQSIAILALGSAALFGCAGAASIERSAGDGSGRDAGYAAADGSAAAPTVGTHIREDFDNEMLIEQASNVVIDLNRGVVTLPTQVFPEIASDHLMTYASDINVNGSVQGGDIVLDQHATLVASDSIELLAKHLLRVTGEIHAGAGGVTLAAGDLVIVDGAIISEGPVKILVGSNSGTVAIAGKVSALSSTPDHPADLRIIARGIVDISGQVTASADMGQPSGNVLISAYGKVTVHGGGAWVVSGARDMGQTGDVTVESETAVEIANGAFVGGQDLSQNTGPPTGQPPPPPMNTTHGAGIARAGDVQVRAPVVTIGQNGTVAGANGYNAKGGSVMVVATAELHTLAQSAIVGGSGQTSGAVNVRSLRTTLDDFSQITGGIGVTAVSEVVVESAARMDLGAHAAILGGTGGCANGGDVFVHVGGLIQGAPAVTIKGGPGGQLVSSLGCDASLHRGGNVELIARVGMDLEGATSGGTGSTQGMVHVVYDASYTVQAPVLEAGTSGFVISKVFDRGAAKMGLSPALVTAKYDQPAGTSVSIQLGGATSPDGPFEFVDLDKKLMTPADKLNADRYFRYRVQLVGRAFDTPLIDYFDIDLAPVPGK